MLQPSIMADEDQTDNLDHLVDQTARMDIAPEATDTLKRRRNGRESAEASQQDDVASITGADHNEGARREKGKVIQALAGRDEMGKAGIRGVNMVSNPGMGECWGAGNEGFKVVQVVSGTEEGKGAGSEGSQTVQDESGSGKVGVKLSGQSVIGPELFETSSEEEEDEEVEGEEKAGQQEEEEPAWTDDSECEKEGGYCQWCKDLLK